MKSNTKVDCSCGCGRSEPANRMTLVRSQWTQGTVTRNGRVSFWVTRDCAAAFEAELMRTHAVEAIVRQDADSGFLRRAAVAAQLYDLQFGIHQRTKGARTRARSRGGACAGG